MIDANTGEGCAEKDTFFVLLNWIVDHCDWEDGVRLYLTPWAILFMSTGVPLGLLGITQMIAAN